MQPPFYTLYYTQFNLSIYNIFLYKLLNLFIV
nr:MAG TPA: hypothetical protein [Bacteriophage sp.]